ncbi:Ig-like domain repeat protein [Nocardioides lianchengensis]|uniref:Ig-like domain (Group 3) n=1 Tax=Nocardioides lianchengensis TaxID=1045774 RepID=A0A1G6TJ43_9ACTN|nr:Ig-like domain repeat protein [Nocardioides lianchengensis]NYG11738.1 hypothetical protein [Nocardioides lianchengensis]SDD29080.1 Ig-like domain (group 3) [Nocardioides lianchengensis]
MQIRVKKTWAAALGLTVALSTAGGVALGAGDDDWYAGDENVTVPDHDKIAATLKLYNASGTEVTSGTASAPIAAIAAVGSPVRAGDTFGTLYAHQVRSDTAPGAWPGIQVSGTSKFSGEGAIAVPAALVNSPAVDADAPGTSTLADVAGSFTTTGGAVANVYELRLRTSSPSGGVGTSYAATYVRVDGDTWEVTDNPGEVEPDPEPVATSVAVAWPASLGYGRAATVGVTVTAASGAAKPTGAVRLLQGTRVLATATLTAAGTASLPIARTALAPGSRPLRVAYLGATDAFVASTSAVKPYTVAKAASGTPVLRITKKPTAKKAGKATVTVAVPAGLAKAGGRATVVLTKGKSVTRVVVAVRSGAASVKLPKLKKGTWSIRVDYQGDAYYLPAKSKTVKVKAK